MPATTENSSAKEQEITSQVHSQIADLNSKLHFSPPNSQPVLQKWEQYVYGMNSVNLWSAKT